MSSYLNIYLQKKEKGNSPKVPLAENKPLLLISFSRSNPIYQCFDECIHPVWNNTGEDYTELTVQSISDCIKDVDDDIESVEKRIREYEIHAHGDKECIDKLISLKEFRKELLDTATKLEFIKELVFDCSISCSDFDTVLCNMG